MMAIANLKKNSVHLYNIVQDPIEAYDQSDSNPTKLAEMKVSVT